MTLEEWQAEMLAEAKRTTEAALRTARAVEATAIHFGVPTKGAKQAQQQQPASAVVAAVASDRDLDDPKYGNPEARFEPRGYNGPPVKGKKMSDCPPEALDALALAYDDFAGKETDEKKKRYKLMDAARARGWAARIRSGRHVSSDGYQGHPDDAPPPSDDVN